MTGHHAGKRSPWQGVLASSGAWYQLRKWKGTARNQVAFLLQEPPCQPLPHGPFLGALASGKPASAAIPASSGGPLSTTFACHPTALRCVQGCKGKCGTEEKAVMHRELWAGEAGKEWAGGSLGMRRLSDRDSCVGSL